MRDKSKVSAWLISIGMTLFLLFTIFYIIIFHGTRANPIYDIGHDTELGAYGTVALEPYQEIKQHFVANTYSFKGINYILIGSGEDVPGEIQFSVETLDGKVLFTTKKAICKIESGQWENIELPTHVKQGQEYIINIQNLSDTTAPIFLTGEKKSVSDFACGLQVEDIQQTQNLIMGFGFRPEYTRFGKITICLFTFLIWGSVMYCIWIKKKATLQESWQQNGRKYYYDFIRLVAIWMVIYNHTVLNGYMLFTEEHGTIIYWIEQYFSIFIVCAVPLFWMMTGALLLNKEEDLKTLFKKRVLRFLIVLIIFTLFQYFYRLYTGKINVKEDGNYFKWVYELTVGVQAYWYLYAYLGYLMMLPFLRKIAKGLKKEEFQYLFVIYTLFTGALPMFEYFVLKGQYHLREDFQIPIMASSCITFVLMGYYIEYVKRQEEFTWKKLLLWIGVSIIFVGITACATTYRCEANDKWSEVFTQFFFKGFIIVPTYTFFYGVKLWARNHVPSIRLQKIGVILGNATFGLMLIENIVREELNFIFDCVVPHFGKFIGGMIWVTSIWGVGFGIAVILKKIPVLKKII